MERMFSQLEIKKITLAFAAAVFLAVSLFGLGFIYEMPEEGMASPLGVKLDCPFSAGISICDMAPVSHIGAWQNVFASLLPSSFALVVLLALAVTVVFLKNKKNISGAPPVLQKKQRSFYDLISVGESGLLKSPLLELFSSGVLNTKIYA